MEQTIRHSAALPRSFALGGYVIEDQLGTGGFGITYAASVKLIPTKRVAIKEYLPADIAHRTDISTVRPNSAIDQNTYADGLRRFINEATHLWNLSNAQSPHPNIVPIEYVFEDNGTAYIVMALLSGATLTEHIHRGETFTEARLAPIIEQLLDALEYVHAHDILHRDIAPTNIILTDGDVPVLIDFGAASGNIKVSTPKTVVVKDGYSPIEQEEGSAQDPRSDIYAMAATLYHLITGQKPTRVLARLRGLREANTDPMPSARELGRGRYSDRMLAAIDVGLAIYPEERPNDVAQWRQMFFAPQAAEPAGGPDLTVPLIRHPAGPRTPPKGEEKTTASISRTPGGRRRDPRARTVRRKRMLRTASRAAAGVAALVALAAGVMLLLPDYEDHIENARDLLAETPVRQEVLLDARDEFTSALDKRPGDSIASDGRTGVDQLLAMFDATAAGDISSARESLATAEQVLARAGFTPSALSPFQARYQQTRLTLTTIDALRRENLEVARSAIDNVHALPDADRINLQRLEDAYVQLDNIDTLLRGNNFEAAYQAVDAGERALVDIGYRAPADLKNWRDAIAVRTGRWLRDAREETQRAIYANPFDATALERARTFYRQQGALNPEAPAAGERLLDLLATAAEEIGRQAETIPGDVEINRLAAELGYPSDFGVRLKRSFREQNAARGIAAPVAGDILDALQGLTGAQAGSLDTLLASQQALQRIDTADSTTFNEDDERIRNSSLAILQSLIAAKQSLQRGEHSVVPARLQTANRSLANIEPTVRAMLTYAVASIDAEHRGMAAAMQAIDKMAQQFGADAVATARGTMIDVLRDDPDNRYAMAGRTVTNHLEEGLKSALVCDLDATRRAFTSARIAWIFDTDTEFIDESFGAIRRNCR